MVRLKISLLQNICVCLYIINFSLSSFLSRRKYAGWNSFKIESFLFFTLFVYLFLVVLWQSEV